MNTDKTGKDLARKSTYRANSKPIRPFIGDRIEAKGLTNVAHLATNECQYPPSPKVTAALKDAISSLNLYPDPSSTLLRRKLAEKFGITETMVTVGNGADELLYMIGKAFIEEGENAVITTPCYPTQVLGIESIGGIVKNVGYRSDFTCDMKAMFEAIDESTKLVLICNPGNPNTKVISQEELDWFMERVPAHVLVVMDEAYKEFIDRPDEAADAMRYFQNDRNILFLRTFSKFYSLAGLRIGYAIGPEHIIDVLRRAIPAFPVNTLAQVAAMAVLDEPEYYADVFKKTVEARNYMTTGLKEAGFKPVEPSQTNFIFVDTCHVPQNIFAEKLFDAGFYIREASYHPFNNHVRITVGTMEQCKRLISIAKEISKEYKG